ncbi:MAG: lysophospholipid acyltransferase family protein [Kineosporiaceae bacterium]
MTPASVALFRLVWPARVHGVDLVPSSGPVVLAGNHLGVLDGPLLVATCPRWTSCLVKAEMFDGPLGAVLRAAGQIPIVREGADRTAMATALHRLRGGGVVGVFPEGTRGRGDVSQARAGAAWLALRSGAPVVPVAVLGTRRTGESTSRPPRPRPVHIVFGDPVALTPAVGTGAATGRTALAAATDQVRAALAAHVTRAVALTGQRLPDDAPPAPAGAPRVTTEGGAA